MYLYRMDTHTCTSYLRVTKPFTSTIKKAQSLKKTRSKRYLAEVHLKIGNSNNTATELKLLFVLYGHGRNIYMLNSVVLNLKTEQQGEKVVQVQTLGSSANQKQRFLPAVFLSP